MSHIRKLSLLSGLTLVIAVSSAWYLRSPELSCSSDNVKTMMTQFVTDSVLQNVAPDQVINITVTTELSAVHTITVADKIHLCQAVITSHAHYHGPSPIGQAPFRFPSTTQLSSAELQTLFDALMQTANLPADLQQIIRQTPTYQNPPRNLGIHGLLTAMIDTIDQPTWQHNDHLGLAFVAINATALYHHAEAADIAASARQTASDTALELQHYTAQVVDHKAAHLDGRICYTVTHHADGKTVYVTMLSQE